VETLLRWLFWNWFSGAGVNKKNTAGRKKDESGTVRFSCVAYRYDGISRFALKDVTVTLARGGITAVIGPNGSGKSTFARHINALLWPVSGTVEVCGMDTADLDLVLEIRRRVGFVFQNFDSQLVGATVEEDIAFGPENLGLSRALIKEAVDFGLEIAGLRELARRPVNMLSGGQKQQLAIAGAVAMRPECLVLDEPTSMIGPAARRSVMNLLRKLEAELNMTIVLVTHHMEEAVLAHRVLVMQNGSVLMDGPPPEIFKSGQLLSGIGLELPKPVELAGRIRKYGVNIPDSFLTVDELVNCLCRL